MVMNKTIYKVLRHFSTYRAGKLRLNQLKLIIPSSKAQTPASWRYFLIASLIIDILIGAQVAQKLNDEYVISIIFDISSGFYNFLDQFSLLLDWMTGAPAGLKLNKELAEILGLFFGYHIHLWRAFVGSIYPFVGNLLRILPYFAYCGFSIFFGITVDSISIYLIHVNCFYVYATRLYRCQLITMRSLLRLFLGKKYNPLRNRIDSITCEPDQLFVGTILLTICIFLLPTTALFYFVFALLRICKGVVMFVFEKLVVWPLTVIECVARSYPEVKEKYFVLDGDNLTVCESSREQVTQVIKALEPVDDGKLGRISEYLKDFLVGEMI